MTYRNMRESGCQKPYFTAEKHDSTRTILTNNQEFGSNTQDFSQKKQDCLVTNPASRAFHGNDDFGDPSPAEYEMLREMAYAKKKQKALAQEGPIPHFNSGLLMLITYIYILL